MKQVCRICAIISISLLSITFGFSMQTDDLRSAPLKNLKELAVTIEAMTPDGEAMGLTSDALQTATELMLRREGLIIAAAPSPKVPYFYVMVNIKDRAASIRVELNEQVTLIRDSSITCSATTWSRGTAGVHSGNPDSIITKVQNLINDFLNDYYKANPKK